MKLSTAEINQSMVDALKGVNNVMEKVNASMDIHSIQECLKEFAKNSEKMEMKQEMVSSNTFISKALNLLLILILLSPIINIKI
jgi:hypothetical protein